MDMNWLSRRKADRTFEQHDGSNAVSSAQSVDNWFAKACVCYIVLSTTPSRAKAVEITYFRLLQSFWR